jgi:hypothetical protein
MSAIPVSNPVTSRSAFIFIYENMNVVMAVDSFIKGEEKKNGSPPRMSLTQNRPKTVEMLKKAKYQFILVDQACMGSVNPLEWIQSLFKEIEGGETHAEELRVFLVASNALSNNDLESFLIAGYDDIFIKPLDMPIVAQKINNITGIEFSKESQLYFAPITSPVKLAYRYDLEGLSEAGAKVVVDEELKAGEVFTIIIPEFEKFGIREIVAKIISCKPHQKQKDKYTANINFVGIQPTVTKSIRRWMVEEYIKAK